jgi:MFS family permease
MTDAAAPARPTFLLLPLAFVNFPVGAGAFLVTGMLSPLAQSLSMSKVQAGWVMSAYALGYALTSPVLIRADRPIAAAHRHSHRDCALRRHEGRRDGGGGCLLGGHHYVLQKAVLLQRVCCGGAHQVNGGGSYSPILGFVHF